MTVSTVSKEAKKTEAICRMKLLGISPETIKQFEEEGIVKQCLPPYGTDCQLKDAQLAQIYVLEETYGALVYYVIHSDMEIGEMDNYLFVSGYIDEEDDEKWLAMEWEMDRKAIDAGRTYAYVYNYDKPRFSEFGTIGIRSTPEGLCRLW